MADNDPAAAARARRLAIEAAIKNGTFGKDATPKPSAPAKPNPKDVPIGSGMAQGASNRISGRQRQIDNAVEQAEKGTLSSARRPRAY